MVKKNNNNHPKLKMQITVKIDMALNNDLRAKLAKLGLSQRGTLTPAIEGAIDCLLNEPDKTIKEHIAKRSKI